MLRYTFIHLPGIGPKIERRLWRRGILTWNDLRAAAPAGVRRDCVRILPAAIDECGRRLKNHDAAWFSGMLNAVQSWRLYHDFKHSVAYLDIETTGLDADAGDQISCIAVYDGTEVRHYVNGDNLADFSRDIADVRLLVTFNGASFDLPFIRRALGVPMAHAHIDLRWVLRGLGLRGGLKSIEHQLGMDRRDLEGVDGYTAVLLWNDYLETGNEKALETLLAYNIADVLNLEVLMVYAHNQYIKDTPMASLLTLPPPVTPENPLQPHLPTLQRFRSR